MMNKYTNLKDPYTYDGSDVLINKFGIRDAHKLEKAERDASFRRVMELWETPIQGNFDLKHLQAIHRTLFSDVYPFAGEIRTIDISKGNSRFAHAPMIEGYLSGEFRKLKSQNYLQGTTIDQFSEKAANVMGEINAAHPFREGNGRATREFIGQLARRNGFEIHWSNISDSEMINASIQSFNGDNRQLELLIRNNISIEASKVNSNELEALAGNKSDKETAYDQFAVEEQVMNIAHKIRTPYAVSSIALSPAQDKVAVANGLLTEILIYDVATGEQVIHLDTDAPSGYENTLLWKGGCLLAAAKSGTQLYVWDAGTFELKYRYEVGPSSIKSMDVDVATRKIVLVLEKPIKAVMDKLGLQDVPNVLQLDLDTGERITEKSIGRELMAGGYTGKNSSLSLLNNSKNEIGEWSLDEIEVHCIKDGNADRLNAGESRRITTHAADEAAWAYNPESNSQIVIVSLPEGRQAFFGALGEEPKSLSCVGEPIGAAAKDSGFVILTQEEDAYFLESVQREDAITILLPGEASNAIASQNGLLAVGVDNSVIMYA